MVIGLVGVCIDFAIGPLQLEPGREALHELNIFDASAIDDC